MAGHAWEAGRGLNTSVCQFRDDAERERFVEQLGETVETDLRGVAAHVLCRFAGRTQREVAAVLGMNTRMTK